MLRFRAAVVMWLCLCVTSVWAQIPFDETIVDSNEPTHPWMKAVGDINGDGQLDLVVAGRGGPVVWYAYPNWSKHVVGNSVGTAGTTTGITLADIDGDDDLDIFLANGVWYEHPGPDGNPVNAWMIRSYGARRGHDIFAVDFDKDGDLDLVTRDQGSNGDQILLYRQNSKTSWTEKMLANVPVGEGLAIGDLDRDDDMDIVLGDRWYENTGDITGGAWTMRLLTGAAAAEPDNVVVLADVNLDNKIDIVVAPAERAGETSKILWYQAPDDAKTTDWTERVVDDPVEAAHHSLQVADMNSDGKLDIITAEMHQSADPDEVKIYVNNGDATVWSKQVLSTAGSHSVQVADIGDDGDMDIFGANWNSSQAPDGAVIKLWENKLDPELVRVKGAWLFYNNSLFDGYNASANPADDLAIATDKQPLSSGQTASFINYSSYARGLNALMVDISNLPGPVTAADFTFKVGNDNNPAAWPPGPIPTALSTRHGDGIEGTDRITLIFADDSIKGKWLQVTVKATTATGLESSEVIYFGNAPGESGNATTDAHVNATDQVNVRLNPRHFLRPADVDDTNDQNRDGRVDATDEIIARNHATDFTNALKLITTP